MKATVWGSRGSIVSAGPETARYAGNTACAALETDEGVCLLDAGPGLQRARARPEINRADAVSIALMGSRDAAWQLPPGPPR